MIIGRDLLEFLGINIRFSDQTVEWDGATMPFKDQDETSDGLFHVQEPDAVLEATERITKILDAKYLPTDLDEYCRTQTQLEHDEQQKLLSLLKKHEHLFDGTLGKWTGTKVKLDLNEGAEPYHAWAFSVPRCHMETVKREVERLCKIGVLKRVKRSQ